MHSDDVLNLFNEGDIDAPSWYCDTMFYMGTRLHKRIGYGYSNNIGSDLESLINPDSVLLDEDRLYEKYGSLETAFGSYVDFATHYQQQKTEAGQRVFLTDPSVYRNDASHDLNRRFARAVLVSNREWDAPVEMVLVTPVWMMEEWSRSSDSIDYVERELAGDSSLDTDVKLLRSNVYPFAGSFLNTETLEPIADNWAIMPYIRARNKGESVGVLDELARNMGIGLSSHEEAERIVHPAPAPDAIVLALWGKLFKESRSAYLMNALYTSYWR